MSPKILKSVSLTIQLDELKGSVNSMMIPARGNRKAFIYSGNYRAAKKKVQDYLEKHYPDLKGYLTDHPQYYYTTVKYEIYDHWLTKSSKYLKLKKKDVGNYIKNAEDVVFEFLGIDDSTIIHLNIYKKLIDQDETTPKISVSINLYEMKVDTKCTLQTT